MTTAKVKTTFRLDRDLVKKFKHRAIDMDKNFTELLEDAMRYYLIGNYNSRR